MKPLPHERWTLDHLLASCYAKKDKFTMVERQYPNLLYKYFQNPNSRLPCTIRRLIQLYERHLHRKVEEQNHRADKASAGYY